MGLEQWYMLTTITWNSENFVSSSSSTSSIPGWRLKDLEDLLLDAPIFSSPYTLPLKERVEDGTRIQKQENYKASRTGGKARHKN
jgi:hypothetical protein